MMLNHYFFMKKTILLTFLLSSALLIMDVSAFAADVNSFSDLAAGGDLTFAQDIVVESATPSVTLPDGTVVDGAHHSLTGVQGTYLNIGSNTSTVTLKNVGAIQDGSSTDNTFSYQNAAGDTGYKKITNSFNGFHKTAWSQNKLLGTVNIDNSVFSNNNDFIFNVGAYYDLPVFMDYYLFLELILATDNHGKNMYLYNYDQTQ